MAMRINDAGGHVRDGGAILPGKIDGATGSDVEQSSCDARQEGEPLTAVKYELLCSAVQQ